MPCVGSPVSTACSSQQTSSTCYVHNPYATPLPPSMAPYTPNPSRFQRPAAYQPPRRQPTACPAAAPEPHHSHHQHSHSHHCEHQHAHKGCQRGAPRGNKRPVCLDYLKNVCHLKRWKCKYAHPPLPLLTCKKTQERKVCEVYMLTGLCKFGDNCRDYHPQLDSTVNPICAPAKVVTEKDSTSDCEVASNLDLRSSSISSSSDSDRGSDTASHATSEGVTVSSSYSSSPKNGLEASMRKVNGILNRLTPEKFDSLLQQMFELLTGDQAEACLTKVLPLVFARAINEPKMCELYARLTKHLYSLVGSDEQPVLQEQLLALSSNLLYKVEDVYDAVKDDPEQLMKLQAKRLGNVQFFGELVKLDTIPYQQLHNVIAFLFQQCSTLQQQGKSSEADFHIELLCRILTTVGGDLNPHRAQSYVHHLQQVSHRHSTRVQMLVLNVVDSCFQKNWK